MKANWKIALMCLATFSFVACDPNKPDQPGDDDNLFDYVRPIEVNDKSIADWDKLDQSKVYEAVCPELPYLPGLLKMRVYADSVCIFYQLTFDPESMPSHTDVDVMHIYINADNSDETGGFWDLFDSPDKGNTDIMFEGAIWDANGTEISYTPTFSTWSGAVNGEGWLWTEAPVSNKVSASQFVGDNIIEGRLVLELIPFKFNDKAFEIGFDIQQNFEGVGLLPQANRPDGDHIGRAKKLYVAFDK